MDITKLLEVLLFGINVNVPLLFFSMRQRVTLLFNTTLAPADVESPWIPRYPKDESADLIEYSPLPR